MESKKAAVIRCAELAKEVRALYSDGVAISFSGIPNASVLLNNEAFFDAFPHYTEGELIPDEERPYRIHSAEYDGILFRCVEYDDERR